MKTRLLLLVALSLASAGLFAQATSPQSTDKNIDNQPVCKVFPDMPKGARPVFPKSAYTPLEDPACAPCYEYRSKLGHLVMECPYLRFPPEHGNQEEAAADMLNVPGNEGAVNVSNNTLGAETQHAFTGNYPRACLRDPDMPANAKQVFPKSAYEPLEDPSCPPCYEYRSKLGHLVMECPFLRFPPEHNNQGQQ